MRLFFHDTQRPRAAAKHLARLSPQLKLSTVQEALARASGYRDWHELASSLGRPDDGGLDSSVAAQDLVLALSESLGLGDAEVQYALAASRFLGQAGSRLDAQLALRAALWRQRAFGPPGRGTPGTVVNVRVRGRPTRRAYLLQSDRAARVLYDEGLGTVADFEVVTPRTPLPDFVPSRLWVPYGCWTLADGSRVIYSRDYLPLWRLASGAVERIEPWWWIKGIQSEMNFAHTLGAADWSEGPAQALALSLLDQHRVVGLPRLVNAMPHLLVPDPKGVPAAVDRLRISLGGGQDAPAYGELNPRLEWG